MFLFPPLIYFLLMINVNDITDSEMWLYGMLINVIVVFLTTLIMVLLAKKKKIPKMEYDERQHFLFGYIGNIVVFLYTYQYAMNIEKWVSVFSLVLLLVFAYKFLISGNVLYREIMMFAIVYSILDYMIIVFTGNTLFGPAYQFTSFESAFFQVLFILILVASFVFYLYKLVTLPRWSLWRYIFVTLLAFDVIIMYVDDSKEKVLATIMILALFSWIIDIITRIIHKEFKLMDWSMYARIIMVTVMLIWFRETKLYNLPQFRVEEMGMLIAIFYVSSLSDILTHIAPKSSLETSLGFTLVDYLKLYYKPVTTRYKDILVISKSDELPHNLSGMGRKILIKPNLESAMNVDLDSVSLVMVYSESLEEFQEVLNSFGHLHPVLLSQTKFEQHGFQTCFSDFQYQIYAQ